jgi:long-chain acyl-CoA synthetase
MAIIPLPTNTLSYHFFTTTITLPRTNYALPRCFRVFSQSNTETVQIIRKCSPFLESSLLVVGNNNNAAVDSSDDWKVVPDIWRSSAEKYGDQVALVDQYHHPPSTMTYNQVFFFFYH